MTAQRGQVGQANYAAAKAGLIGFTKTIALELAGFGITANCIAPGFVRTEMTAAMPEAVLTAEASRIPVKRLGTPDDIAAAAAYLASDAASFVTGQVLAVNGGQYL
jgi:acetoacetyl-CoA reductase